MSLLFNTDLKEYARQCALQRRRYEDRLQAQQSDSLGDATKTRVIVQTIEEREPVDASRLAKRTEQKTQSCVADLLEIPVETLGWDDRNLGLDETKNAVAEEHVWQNDRAQKSHQRVTNSTGKSMSSVGYGAP